MCVNVCLFMSQVRLVPSALAGSGTKVVGRKGGDNCQRQPRSVLRADPRLPAAPRPPVDPFISPPTHPPHSNKCQLRPDVAQGPLIRLVGGPTPVVLVRVSMWVARGSFRCSALTCVTLENIDACDHVHSSWAGFRLEAVIICVYNVQYGILGQWGPIVASDRLSQHLQSPPYLMKL